MIFVLEFTFQMKVTAVQLKQCKKETTGVKCCHYLYFNCSTDGVMVTIYLAVAAAFSLVFIYKFLKNQLWVKNIRMEMITATKWGWIHFCPNMMCSCSCLLCTAFLKPNFFSPFFLIFSKYKYILADFYQKVFNKMLNKPFSNKHLISKSLICIIVIQSFWAK